MHIDKVKERLSELARISEEGAKLHPEDSEMFITDKEALETALNYINNSISKDKIREKIEECEKFIIDDENFSPLHKNDKELLEELLKEE